MLCNGYYGHGGGRIKRHSLITALLLLFVVVMMPVDDVNATDTSSVNQTSNITSNTTQNTTNDTVTNNISTSNLTKVSYTYYVKVPYKVKVQVAYKKYYKVKTWYKVKSWYKYYGKWRYKYVYRYKYVTKYQTAYKWVYKTKYKKVAKTGYKYVSTDNQTNSSVKSASTKNSSSDLVSYTYYVNVPYKVKAKIAYYKPYKVKIWTKVKKWYRYYGKWRYKYVYRYKYVTKYQRAYKWGYKTKFKKVAKTGYLNISDYLKETKNCQVSNPTIQSFAHNLTKNANTTYDKALKIFNWVRNNLDYSFYYNTKYGAVKTLATKTANCCDHTNLLIALARAEGIPARYVHGKCTFNSGNVYGHVWGQFFIDGKWYDADATSFSNTLGSIKNWNTATATIKGYYTELPF